MAPVPTMDQSEDPFESDWQTLLDTHPVMSMSREQKGERGHEQGRRVSGVMSRGV